MAAVITLSHAAEISLCALSTMLRTDMGLTTSTKNLLKNFHFVFIVKKNNNLSVWFSGEMVWARSSRVKQNPVQHCGNVRTCSKCKANWGRFNSVVHTNVISNPRPQKWDPCTAFHFVHPHPNCLLNWLSSAVFVRRTRGLMSHPAKRTDYLRISSTLVCQRLGVSCLTSIENRAGRVV